MGLTFKYPTLQRIWKITNFGGDLILSIGDLRPWYPSTSSGCTQGARGVSPANKRPQGFPKTLGVFLEGVQPLTRAFIQALLLWKSAIALPGWTNSSKRERSASARLISRTGRASSRWAMVRGPMMGEVMPGWSLTHNKASWVTLIS